MSEEIKKEAHAEHTNELVDRYAEILSPEMLNGTSHWYNDFVDKYIDKATLAERKRILHIIEYTIPENAIIGGPVKKLLYKNIEKDDNTLITCSIDGSKYSKDHLCSKCYGGGPDRRMTK